MNVQATYQNADSDRHLNSNTLKYIRTGIGLIRRRTISLCMSVCTGILYDKRTT